MTNKKQMYVVLQHGNDKIQHGSYSWDEAIKKKDELNIKTNFRWFIAEYNEAGINKRSPSKLE